MYVNISSNKYNGSGTRKIKESKAKQIIQVVPADDDTPFGTFLIIIIYYIDPSLLFFIFYSSRLVTVGDGTWYWIDKSK